MPLPLIAIAGAALVGAVGYAGYRYYQGLRSGRPPSLGELGRAALVGGVAGTLAGTAAVAATIGFTSAAVTAPTATYGAVQLVRVADDFVDDGRVNGSTRPGSTAGAQAGRTQSAATARPAPRPLFDSAAARERLAAQLEESERARVAAGAPTADQVTDAMNGIAGMIGGGSGAGARPAGTASSTPVRVPTPDEAADVLNGIADQIEASRRPAPSSRGITAALPGGTGR